MRQFIKYFIKYPISGNVILFALLILGFLALLGMKSTFFPEFESRTISIQVVYPGAAPEEVEEGVVLKIEDNLKGLSGIEKVTSVSSENTGSITVEVEKGYDPDLVLQDVKNAVDRIPSFPTGMEPPVIYKRESLNFAISFALSGDMDLKTLKREARRVENELLSEDFISKVELSGFPDEEIQISLREDDMQAYSLSFDEVVLAIRAANLEVTGGTIKAEREELLVRSQDKAYYAKGLQDIIVKSSVNGQVVRLREIADVTDRWSDNPNRNYMNGEPSVSVTVSNTIEEDLLTITSFVSEYIEEFNENNEDIQATVIRDGSISLRQRIQLLTKNGVIGFCLVLLFLALFLDIRLAFWVAIAIPVCFMGMFIFANIAGITINVISLFGMILVIGILVDDGIVISENIFQHYEKGEPRIKAAINGTMEVLPAVFSAIITTVVAFLFFFFLDGRVGDFFPEMAFVVIATLFLSLVEGALILPGHVAHSKALAPNKKLNFIQKGTYALMDFLRDKIYAPVLDLFLRFKAMGVGLAIMTMIVTVGGLQSGVIKTTFFPFIERDNITVSLKMPAGTREHVTQKWIDHIEAAALRVNDSLQATREDGRNIIQSIDKRVGPSTYQATLNVILLDGEARNMQSLQIAGLIGKEAGPIYEAENVEYGIQGAFGKPLSIALLGNNLDELEAMTQELQTQLKEIDGLRDVLDNNQIGLREVDVKLKEKARLLGLNAQTILSQVRQGFFGAEVQRLQRGLDEVKVWVRYSEDDRSSIGKLEGMRIRVGTSSYPLSELATLQIGRGVVSINHLDGKREVRVEADISRPDVSVTDIIADVQADVMPPLLAKYPSVTAVYEGQSEQSDKTAKSAQSAMPVILLTMFFIVVLTFRSFSQSFIVFLLIPFGLVGAAWGHFLWGKPMSILSFLGMIALVGIIINDSLVFVAAFNQYLKEGLNVRDAVYEAGKSRFRPIVLTSATTIAGLAPLIAEKSFQAQFLIPMAISVSYGLLAATFLTLLLLPVFLLALNSMRVGIKGVFRAASGDERWPTPEEVEPAVKEMEADQEKDYQEEDEEELPLGID